MDLSNIAAAKKGTTDILRIYQNDIIVYNKYNWEKWNVNTTSQKVYDDVYKGYSYVSTIQYTDYAYLYRIMDTSKGYVELLNNISTSKMIIQCASGGYIYLPVNYSVSINKPYEYDVIDVSSINFNTPNSGDTARLDRYKVELASTEYTYSKGATSYGVVQGYAGDYPDNGKQGNYWYVKVTA